MGSEHLGDHLTLYLGWEVNISEISTNAEEKAPILERFLFAENSSQFLKMESFANVKLIWPRAETLLATLQGDAPHNSCLPRLFNMQEKAHVQRLD